jgi:hypothetical protein
METIRTIVFFTLLILTFGTPGVLLLCSTIIIGVKKVFKYLYKVQLAGFVVWGVGNLSKINYIQTFEMMNSNTMPWFPFAPWYGICLLIIADAIFIRNIIKSFSQKKKSS